MKMNKKKLAVISLVLCVVAVISMGSLAWFTAEDTVENKLQFVKDFQMDLYETDKDGNPIKSGDDTIGQTYENVRPNATLHKDPTVINKSAAEDQWIRVTVTVDKADKWKEALTALEITDLSTIFTGHSSTLWTRYDAPAEDATNKTISYTFYLNSKLEHGKTATLFTGVHIPEGMTIAQAKAIEESKITVKAEAMQASDLGEGVTGDNACYLAFNNPTKAAE